MSITRTPNLLDLSWFIDMDAQNRLDFDPPYQRKSVWTPKDRYEFLDTIFKNYPCPAIYLHKEIVAKGPKYNIVDGKQRLTTVINFFKDKIRLPKDFDVADLRGKKFSQLNGEQKSIFYNYIFTVENLTSNDDEDWNQVFFRVNKNQKRLTEQELRHARFDGWFINRAEKELDDPRSPSAKLWVALKVSTSGRSKRMKDVEFVSILMLVTLENSIVGFPQLNIDELYAKYDYKAGELAGELVSDFNEETDDVVSESIDDQIQDFESKFGDLKKFVKQMDEHNACISGHSKRVTTDFYSLWSLLSLDDYYQSLDSVKTADIYLEFIDKVDVVYELSKRSESYDNFPDEVKTYYNNSIGAATIVENRRKRYEALKSFVERYED